MIDVIEARIDESETVPWAKSDQQFHFLESQIVVFDTGVRVAEPKDLAGILPKLSAGSIFYHFIDARRRDPDSLDDFSHWLNGFEAPHADLVQQIATLDPYFASLTDLRSQLAAVFLHHAEKEER